jgi:CRISPR/Cas system-associated exonuclease Cas4 (RecB family)
MPIWQCLEDFGGIMSLRVKLYHDSDDFFGQDTWNQGDSKNATLLICPSPAEADQVRTRLVDYPNIDVLTISKFMSHEFSRLENPPVIARKADLMLKLSVFWKKIFPEYGYERFAQCFTLLTELRGTTLELETIQEILEEYHPDVANGIAMLWRSMEATELFDEHASYSLLSEAYRQTPSPLEKETYEKLVFYGFSHLSGLQVDMLKALALRHEVIVPYRNILYQARQQSDWISWIGTEEIVQTDGDDIENMPLKKAYDVYYFPKNRLAENLKKTVALPADFILGVSKPVLRDYLEIPFGGLFFKSSLDLLEESFLEIENEIREMMAHALGGTLNIDSVREWIIQSKKKSIKTQNFRLIKAIDLMTEVVEEWSDLASQNTEISTFDWEVIKNNMRLKAPRVYHAPNISNKKELGKIRGFNEIVSIAADQKVYICLTSSHASPKISESEYSSKVASLLMSLGPKRRKELDFVKLREEFREVLKRCHVTFYIESGLLEHDLGWAEMLQGLELKEVKSESHNKKERKDLLSQRELVKAVPFESISPSRLQTYVDCPRQYYFRYVENVSDQAGLKSDLETRFLGEIEHDVVAKYLKQNQGWDDEIHQRVCLEVMNITLQKEKIVLKPAQRAAHLSEIREYSKAGIEFVFALMQKLPEPRLIFEAPFEHVGFKGRVDLLIETSMGIGILDFKRSSASVPNKSAHESFEKIQLWNYLTHVPGVETPPDILFWGYVCLKDVSDSLFYYSWSELEDVFDKTFEDRPKRYFLETQQLRQKIVEYGEFENEVLNKLKKDEYWLPLPKNIDACKFCRVNRLCARGLL